MLSNKCYRVTYGRIGFAERCEIESTDKPRERKPRLRGRLKTAYAFWATFCSAFILGWIWSGVQLEWIDGPPPDKYFPNSGTALREVEFITGGCGEFD